MVIVNNWTRDLAADLTEYSSLTEQELVAAIEFRCPFVKDMAYMPVPRCELCANAVPLDKTQHIICSELRDESGSPMEFPIWFGCVRFQPIVQNSPQQKI